MTASVAGIHLTGIHSARPAANTVPDGSLYSCTTHSLIYQSSYAGNSWSTWATLGTGTFTDPMTTRGDIIVRDSSNVTARLARGSADTVLKSDGTDVAYGKVLPANLDVSADNTTADATTGHHGLLPKLDGNAAHYLDGSGAYSTPSGGGGGSSALVPVQSAQATGSPAGSVTVAAPASGSCMVLIGQTNGSNYSSITQTNVTWTNRRNDSVGGVGDLFIWTGAVSGTGGTTITLGSGSGGGSVLVIELASKTYSALGSNNTYAQQLSTNIKTTAKLPTVAAGKLVAFIVHGAGTTVTSPAILSCPHIWCTVDTVGGLAFGFPGEGLDVMGYNASATKYYTLAELSFT